VIGRHATIADALAEEPLGEIPVEGLLGVISGLHIGPDHLRYVRVFVAVLNRIKIRWITEEVPYPRAHASALSLLKIDISKFLSFIGHEHLSDFGALVLPV